MEEGKHGSMFSSLWQQMGKAETLLEELLNSVPAGIVIVDKKGHILFFNEQAERLFEYRGDEVIGQLVEILLPERFRQIHPIFRKHFVQNPIPREMGHERNLWARRKNGSEFPIEVGLGVHTQGKDLYISAIVVDISQRKAVEAERELLITELKEALEKIKQLKGMLPICANCKKIRDDTGYWNQLESYIRDHTDAEFTHSICPECAKKLYPDFS